MKKIFFKYIDPNYMVMFFRTFALILIVITTYLIITNWQENKSLIGALGILVSALLASYSVILSIDTTIKLKNIEISNKIRYVFFHLCLIKIKLITLSNESQKDKISYIDLDRITDSIHEVNTILSEINSQDIISILHNKVLEDLHFLHLNLNLQSTAFKSMIKNVKRPEVGTVNGYVVPNPLKIDLKLEDSIKRISNILTYLRKGYKKDFPDKGGIEECSKIQSKLEHDISNKSLEEKQV